MKINEKEPIYIMFYSHFKNDGVVFNRNKDSIIKNDKLNNYQTIKNYYINQNMKIFDLSNIDNAEKEEIYFLEIKRFDKSKPVLLITNNQNLFTNFFRPISIIDIKEISKVNELNCDIFLLINAIKMGEIELINIIIKILHGFFEVYNKTFTLNLELLTNKTSFNVISIDELYQLIRDEDLNLLQQEQILTSRLLIILYRLCFFDLNANIKTIGEFFKRELNIKSKSYKFEYLNNNSYGFYYQDLVNKSFRGYQLPEQLVIVDIEPFFEEKIRIAKKLLKSKVKMKIVANVLDIEEKKLNDIIYGNYNSVTQNNNQQTTNTSPNQESLKEACKGVKIEVTKEIKGIGISSVDISDSGC